LSNYFIHFSKAIKIRRRFLSMLYDEATCSHHFNTIFVISFVELGRFHGRVTSSGLVLQHANVQCVCILLAWNWTDGAGK